MAQCERCAFCVGAEHPAEFLLLVACALPPVCRLHRPRVAPLQQHARAGPQEVRRILQDTRDRPLSPSALPFRTPHANMRAPHVPPPTPINPYPTSYSSPPPLPAPIPSPPLPSPPAPSHLATTAQSPHWPAFFLRTISTEKKNKQNGGLARVGVISLICPSQVFMLTRERNRFHGTGPAAFQETEVHICSSAINGEFTFRNLV